MLLGQTSDVGPRNIDTHEIDQLAGAMGEARERPSRRAVLEIELDLAYAISRANRVDRHAHLHAEVGCEGQHVRSGVCAIRPERAEERPRTHRDGRQQPGGGPQSSSQIQWKFSNYNAALEVKNNRMKFLDTIEGLNVLSRGQTYYHRPGNWATRGL